MTTIPSTQPDAWEIRPARAEDRLPLYRMLELYQHDLSDIYPQDLDAHGEYGYALDRYFSPGARHAFVGLVGGHFAGFALADGTPGAVKVGSTGHWMEQFFVLKKYRRSGFGTALARAAFEACPGDWEVGQMAMNLPAQVVRVGELVNAVARAAGTHAARVTWEPDPLIEAQFGRVPPLHASRAIAAGFRADEGLEALVEAAFAGLTFSR